MRVVHGVALRVRRLVDVVFLVVLLRRPEQVRAVILQKITQVAEAERNLLLRSTNCAAGQIDKIYQNVEAIWQKLGLELYRHLF